MADKALRVSLEKEEFISSDFLMTSVSRVRMGATKFIAYPKKYFLKFHGRRLVRKLLRSKRVLSKYDFLMVWWNDLERTQQQFLKMSQVSLTK